MSRIAESGLGLAASSVDRSLASSPLLFLREAFWAAIAKLKAAKTAAPSSGMSAVFLRTLLLASGSHSKQRMAVRARWTAVLWRSRTCRASDSQAGHISAGRRASNVRCRTGPLEAFDRDSVLVGAGLLGMPALCPRPCPKSTPSVLELASFDLQASYTTILRCPRRVQAPAAAAGAK